jgi:hypothetical protein
MRRPDKSRWSINDAAGGQPTTLFDTDTAAAGSVFSVTRTGAEAYSAKMQPLGAAAPFALSGTFKTGSPIDWIEFTFFNTPTNTTTATDFYISNMQIVPEPTTSTLLAVGVGGALWGRASTGAQSVSGMRWTRMPANKVRFQFARRRESSVSRRHFCSTPIHCRQRTVGRANRCDVRK